LEGEVAIFGDLEDLEVEDMDVVVIPRKRKISQGCLWMVLEWDPTDAALIYLDIGKTTHLNIGKTGASDIARR
jgi:hypothetical protein